MEDIPEQMSDWERELVGMREGKDQMFASAESPIPPGERQNFAGLRYYAPDSAYRVDARFEKFEEQDPVMIGTSTGETREMIRAGRVHFIIKGDSLQLIAYQHIPSHGSLFLPFGDETNSIETYAGGRYIDIPTESVAESLQIDFNKAYNPYCAYSEEWSCPLVPRENYLPVPIQAGEKSYARE